jgi:predicted amidohydrolase
MSAVRIATLAQAIGRPADFAGWAAAMEARVAEAAAAGAELLLMAEYGAVEVAAALTATPDLDAELAAVVDHADQVLEAWRAAARRHRVWLAPGSLPMRGGNGVHNRAPLIAPDGGLAMQDKAIMTRFESELWDVRPGAGPAVFETPWGPVGIAICFDCEFPTLVRAQVEAGAWLILVPSCTDTLAGFNRVRLSARARALENQCFVAVSPTVGAAPWLGTLDINVGRAGVYGPVDRGYPDDGIIAEGAMDTPGWVYADLDPVPLRVVREQGQVRNHLSWPAGPISIAPVVPVAEAARETEPATP